VLCAAISQAYTTSPHPEKQTHPNELQFFLAAQWWWWAVVVA